MLLTTVNETEKNPVHLLFNQWWAHAPDEVKQAYVDGFANDPHYADLVSGTQLAEPLDLDELGALPDGTLGRAYHSWIVDNGLTAQIAMNYRQFHEMLATSGQLDGMPEPMKAAVLRGSLAPAGGQRTEGLIDVDGELVAWSFDGDGLHVGDTAARVTVEELG